MKLSDDRYKCKKCGRTFDRFQKADRNSNIKCIYCDSNAHRIFSPVGIIFKGSGFYTTDYKSSSSKSGNSKGVSTDKQKGNKKPEIQPSSEKVAGAVSDKKDKKLK